jgi:hypothetical protein
MALNNTPEKGLSTAPSSVEAKQEMTRVAAPKAVTDILATLESIENVSSRVSERTGEDRSGDMGSAGGVATTQQAQTSWRDQAIANIPAPTVMRQDLQKHLLGEVKKLEKLAKRSARIGTKGGAHNLNEIYSRIRKLKGLLAELWEASVDVLKRLFIKVFIDKQPIL